MDCQTTVWYDHQRAIKAHIRFLHVIIGKKIERERERGERGKQVLNKERVRRRCSGIVFSSSSLYFFAHVHNNDVQRERKKGGEFFPSIFWLKFELDTGEWGSYDIEKHFHFFRSRLLTITFNGTLFTFTVLFFRSFFVRLCFHFVCEEDLHWFLCSAEKKINNKTQSKDLQYKKKHFCLFFPSNKELIFSVAYHQSPGTRFNHWGKQTSETQIRMIVLSCNRRKQSTAKSLWWQFIHNFFRFHLSHRFSDNSHCCLFPTNKTSLEKTFLQKQQHRLPLYRQQKIKLSVSPLRNSCKLTHYSSFSIETTFSFVSKQCLKSLNWLANDSKLWLVILMTNFWVISCNTRFVLLLTKPLKDLRKLHLFVEMKDF